MKSPDELKTYILGNETISSEIVNVPVKTVGYMTPVECLRMHYFKDWRVNPVFPGEECQPYLLEIYLHDQATPNMRHRDAYGVKASLDYFGGNKNEIYGYPDNYKENKNGAIIVVAAPDMDKFLQNASNGDILFDWPTIETFKTFTNDAWPKFKEKAKGKVYA